MHARYFYTIIFSFLVGVAIRSGFGFVPGSTFIIPLTLAIVAVVIVFFLLTRDYDTRILLVIPLALIMISLGMVRFDITQTEDATLLKQYIGQEIEIEGTIVEDPDERQTNQKLIIRADAFSHDNDSLEVETKVLITTELARTYRYGDRITAVGTIQQPKNFVGDTDREFDYVNYLGKDGIYYQMFSDDIDVLSSGHGNVIKRGLLDLKNKFITVINRHIVQPEGALLSGILFGEKSALGGDLQKDFRTTGIIHIVVLSGYNVTIVADAIARFFQSFLAPRIALAAGSIGIVLFAILTGAGATVLRASIMALLVIVAKFVGREYMITRALFLAAFLMVLHNPKILLFDISFQLSFLATLGLIYVVPRIENTFAWIPGAFQIRQNFLATISTQLFVLPLLIYYMGELSLVSIPVNVLILVIIPLTMLLGFLTALFGLASGVAAFVMSAPTFWLLSYQTHIVDFFARLPFASVTLPQFSFGLIVLVYIPLLTWIWWLNRKKPVDENIDEATLWRG